jgi:hypothetical protein
VIKYSPKPITIATIALTKKFKARFLGTLVPVLSAAATQLSKQLSASDPGENE